MTDRERKKLEALATENARLREALIFLNWLECDNQSDLANAATAITAAALKGDPLPRVRELTQVEAADFIARQATTLPNEGKTK